MTRLVVGVSLGLGLLVLGGERVGARQSPDPGNRFYDSHFHFMSGLRTNMSTDATHLHRHRR
jgi:hypothetical protein